MLPRLRMRGWRLPGRFLMRPPWITVSFLSCSVRPLPARQRQVVGLLEMPPSEVMWL